MLTDTQLTAILRFDTCAISDAIEQFGVRLRNEGFTRPGLRCFTREGARILGYAATFRVRSSDPPITGGAFLERTDWWDAVAKVKAPRIAVIRDMEPATYGSCVGPVHASLLKALGCQAVITNGAVRGTTTIRKLGIDMFARYLAVSHSYAHIIDYGRPVEILGLEIQQGDLIYADCHGAVSIPPEIATEVAAAALKIQEREARIAEACLRPSPSREEILQTIRSRDERRKDS